MDTSSSSTPTPSEEAVPKTMQHGLEQIVIYTGAGMLIGGLMGLVLSRGGAGSGARKAIAGFGGGVGLGSAWTRCNMELEDLLSGSSAK